MRLGVAGASASTMVASAADWRTKGAHDDVITSGRPGLAGLTTTVAGPSSNSSEATASGSRAGDPFNRCEQRASGLVHGRARMLVRNVAHEARNGGEASAGALAAPVMTIAREVAVSGRTGREQPRATERLRCVHARRDQNSRSELSERAPKPAREPALVVPHDTWVHSGEQTETTRLGSQRPARRAQAAVVCRGATRHEHLSVQVWVQA